MKPTELTGKAQSPIYRREQGDLCSSCYVCFHSTSAWKTSNLS